MREQLKKLRQKNELNHYQMAKLLGVSRASYIKIERNERNGDFKFWATLGQVFNLSLNKLVKMHDEFKAEK